MNPNFKFASDTLATPASKLFLGDVNTAQNTQVTETPIQPPITNTTVSADALSTPVTQVTVPEPITAPTPTLPPEVSGVATDLTNFITAQSEEQTQLENLRKEQAALAGETSLANMFTRQSDKFGIPENLNQLKEIQLQLADMATGSRLTQSRIAGAEGQTLGQAQREIGQEQKEANIRSMGLAAQASVLQGNIQTATSLVNQAVQTAYQDRMLRNTNLSNQITSLQSVVDNQTSQLLEKEKRKYEEDQMQIERAIASVDAATASGFASQEDIATMSALSGNPQQQKEYADKIIAKASRTQYLDALAATRAAANAARQSAQDEIVGNARAQAVSAQTALDVIDVIKNNPLGIKAIAGSNAFGRTALSAAGESATRGFVGGTGVGAIGGSFIPVAGTAFGGALGGVTGLIGGAGVGTYQASKQRSDVAAGLGYLVNSETFAEMRRLKEGGVTFGSLTEGERIAIGKSANELFTAMDIDQSGTVLGVKTSEENFNRLLNNFQEKQKVYLNESQRIAGGFSAEDYTAIQNLGN